MTRQNSVFFLFFNRLFVTLQHMKPLRLTFLLLTALFCSTVSAQKQIVVADVETRIPVGDVSVVAGGKTTVSDSSGCVSVPENSKTLLLSHVNYESMLVNLSDISDTVFIYSKSLYIKEIMVFGQKHGEDEIKALEKRLRIDKTEAELMAIDPRSGGNLLSLIGRIIPKKWKKNSKAERKKRLKKVLDEY